MARDRSEHSGACMRVDVHWRPATGERAPGRRTRGCAGPERAGRRVPGDRTGSEVIGVGERNRRAGAAGQKHRQHGERQDPTTPQAPAFGCRGLEHDHIGTIPSASVALFGWRTGCRVESVRWSSIPERLATGSIPARRRYSPAGTDGSRWRRGRSGHRCWSRPRTSWTRCPNRTDRWRQHDRCRRPGRWRQPRRLRRLVVCASLVVGASLIVAAGLIGAGRIGGLPRMAGRVTGVMSCDAMMPGRCLRACAGERACKRQR